MCKDKTWKTFKFPIHYCYMNHETQLAFLVIKIGFIVLFARGIIVATFLWQIIGIPKNVVIRPLFWWAMIGFIIATFEVSFIELVNTFPSYFVPFLNHFNIGDTYFISPLYYLNEILFLGLFFANLLEGNGKSWITRITLLLFILELCNTIFWEGFHDPQKFGTFIMALYIIVLSLIFFKNNILKGVNRPLVNDAYNIIVWGLFGINSLSILIYFFSDSLFSDFPLIFYQLSIFRMLFESLCLLVVAVGVSKVKLNKFKPA